MSPARLLPMITCALLTVSFQASLQASQYKVLDGYGDTSFTQGTVATSIEICQIINHPILQAGAGPSLSVTTPRARFEWPFPIPDEAVSRLLQDIPPKYDFLRLDDSSFDLVISNAKECISTLPREATVNFFGHEGHSFFRIEMESNDQNDRWRHFLKVVALAQTHPFLLDAMNRKHEKLLQQQAIEAIERARAEEIARANAERQMHERRLIEQDQIAQTEQIPKSNAEQRVVEKRIGERDQTELDASKSRQSGQVQAPKPDPKLDSNHDQTKEAHLAFLKQLLINVGLILLIMTGSFIRFKRKIDDEKEYYLRQIG